MSENYSARSNFKIRSRNANISEIYSTKFGSPIALGAPKDFYPVRGVSGLMHVANGGTVPNYWPYVVDIPINGNDAETGFVKPTGSPLYASVRYGVYVIDWMRGFVTDDMAGVATTATFALEPDVIDGVATTALSMTQLAAPDATFNNPFHAGGI